MLEQVHHIVCFSLCTRCLGWYFIVLCLCVWPSIKRLFCDQFSPPDTETQMRQVCQTVTQSSPVNCGCGCAFPQLSLGLSAVFERNTPIPVLTERPSMHHIVMAHMTKGRGQEHVRAYFFFSHSFPVLRWKLMLFLVWWRRCFEELFFSFHALLDDLDVKDCLCFPSYSEVIELICSHSFQHFSGKWFHPSWLHDFMSVGISKL